MATGLFTLASLLVAASASPTDHWATNHRSLSVPIKFVERRPDIRQMILYVSDDQGKNWSESAVAAPDKESFPFYARTDGMYWMKLCAVYRDGTRSPSDISKGPPALKILVDTSNPTVHIVNAERQGDGISVRWEIQEDHPDLASLKVEYRSAEDPSQQWYAAAVDPLLTGYTRLRFPAAGGLSIRVQLRDTAGNVGTETVDVPAAGLAPTSGYGPITQTSATTVASAPGMLPAIPLNAPPPTPPPAPVNVAWESPSSHRAAAPAPYEPTRAVLSSTSSPSFPGYQGTANAGPSMNRVIGSSDAALASLSPAPQTIHPPRGMLPPKQIVNSTQVTLKYDVKNLGPSGVGRVELWITDDEGHNWKQLCTAVNPESDLMPAELPGEGVYGLRLVVLSKAGRGKQPPRPGDLPEMMVEVDQTAPAIIINMPEPDPHHPNTLVLTWTINEKNLALTPVTLAYSESRTGEWKQIAANVANTGRHSWRLPANVPTSVYLKLSARDLAGNVSEAVTDQPVLVDLSEPEGHLIGIIGGPVRQ